MCDELWGQKEHLQMISNKNSQKGMARAENGKKQVAYRGTASDTTREIKKGMSTKNWEHGMRTIMRERLLNYDEWNDRRLWLMGISMPIKL